MRLSDYKHVTIVKGNENHRTRFKYLNNSPAPQRIIEQPDLVILLKDDGPKVIKNRYTDSIEFTADELAKLVLIS